MNITRRYGTSPAHRGCGPDNVGCPDVLELADGNFLVIGKVPTTGLIPMKEFLLHAAGVGDDEHAVIVPGDVLRAAAQDIVQDDTTPRTTRPNGRTVRIRPTAVSFLQWDSVSREEATQWLGDAPHTWTEDGHLVINNCEEPGEGVDGGVWLRPGWYLIGWPDNAVTVAAPRAARRLFGAALEHTDA